MVLGLLLQHDLGEVQSGNLLLDVAGAAANSNELGSNAITFSVGHLAESRKPENAGTNDARR